MAPPPSTEAEALHEIAEAITAASTRIAAALDTHTAAMREVATSLRSLRGVRPPPAP
jgi:hypothetical protein